MGIVNGVRLERLKDWEGALQEGDWKGLRRQGCVGDGVHLG